MGLRTITARHRPKLGRWHAVIDSLRLPAGPLCVLKPSVRPWRLAPPGGLLPGRGRPRQLDGRAGPAAVSAAALLWRRVLARPTLAGARLSRAAISFVVGSMFL
jgi:hypothetical protein